RAAIPGAIGLLGGDEGAAARGHGGGVAAGRLEECEHRRGGGGGRAERAVGPLGFLEAGDGRLGGEVDAAVERGVLAQRRDPFRGQFDGRILVREPPAAVCPKVAERRERYRELLLLVRRRLAAYAQDAQRERDVQRVRSIESDTVPE